LTDKNVHVSYLQRLIIFIADVGVGRTVLWKCLGNVF